MTVVFEARAKGAFTRSRGIKNEEELLMLNLLYLTDGASYQATSTLIKLAGDISINKNATKNRIVKSKNWLKWLSENISLKNESSIPKPGFLEDKNVLLIDASDVSVKGSKGSDYILRLRTKAFMLYDEKGSKIDILSRVKDMEEWENRSINCFYKHNQEFKKIRICVMKKDKKSCEESKRKSENTVT